MCYKATISSFTYKFTRVGYTNETLFVSLISFLKGNRCFVFAETSRSLCETHLHLLRVICGRIGLTSISVIVFAALASFVERESGFDQ